MLPSDHADFTRACIVLGDAPTAVALRISDWVIDEIGSRQLGTMKGWQRYSSKECPLSTVVAIDQGRETSAVPDHCGDLPLSPGSFLLSEAHGHLSLLAVDSDGLQAGAGRLLRELHMPARGQGGVVSMPSGLCVRHDSALSERWHVRGHQIYADHHPLQFRTAAEMTQFAKDLAVFGTNTLEVAHIGGKVDPNALGAFSDVCASVGMNASVWAPERMWTINSSATHQTFARMSALTSVFMPGGDGGTLDWASIEKLALTLRAARGNQAGIWVSAQELSTDGMEAFWGNVTRMRQKQVLHGVVYGPHVRVPLTEFVKRARMAGAVVRQYPDITHTLSDGFPLPLLDPAWSLTHGRQAVCPLPSWTAHIVELRSNGSTPTVGVGAYSEGLGDDLNKMLWSALAQDASLSLDDAVLQYARFFFGAPAAAKWAAALKGLEANWKGSPGAANTVIPQTLAQIESLVETDSANCTPAKCTRADWRAQMYLKRAYYDAYVRRRYMFEVELNEQDAWRALAQAPAVGSLPALAAARAALARRDPNASLAAHLRVHVFRLAAALNASIGLEVLGNQDVTGNLKTIDTPLSDAAFIKDAVRTITAMASETARLAGIAKLVNHSDPGPGGFYDNLGATDVHLAPHLDTGEGVKSDPGFYFTPLRVGPTAHSLDLNIRRSWSQYAMSFFDYPAVRLTYAGLEATRVYEAHVVFNTLPEPASTGGGVGSGDNGHPMRLVATDRVEGTAVVVWPPPPLNYSSAPWPMTKTIAPIPHSLTRGGSFSLSCNQPPGLNGNGRTCQISEVWLVVAGSIP